MSQDYSQLMYVDATAVAGASTVYLNSITLYFKAKPDISNNKSGIYAPQAYMFVVPVENNLPAVDPLVHYPVAEVEWGSVRTSGDASLPTVFDFDGKVALKTNTMYAFIVKFDGNEDFYLWFNAKNEVFVGTSTVSSGPTAKYVGPLYGYISSNVTSSNTSSYLATNWKPILATSLKFSVDVARYSIGGVLVANGSTESEGNSLIVISNNTLKITAPSYPTEYILYDRKRSNTQSILYGDVVYQDQLFYPGNKPIPATCGVTNSSNFILANTAYFLSNGSAFSFNALYNYGDDLEFIVVVSQNHNGPNSHLVNVRRVVTAYNNTAGIQVDRPMSFTNAAAFFFKAPIGRIFSTSRNFLDGTYQDLLIVKDSRSNASCRFVNNSINAFSIANGGSGYANSDYLSISGYENVGAEVAGGYIAVANLVTNSTGGIINLYFSNTGAGFVNTSLISFTVKNANNATSAGSGAGITFTSDCVLKTESSGGGTYFAGAVVTNLDFAQALPVINIAIPSGTTYTAQFQTAYYKSASANTISGQAYYRTTSANSYTIDATNQKSINFHEADKAPVLPSRSNEFAIRYANGATPNTSVVGSSFSNAAVFILSVSSNNDYVIAHLDQDSIDSYYDKYNINNDYTGEEGNYGNAISKHVTSKVTLQKDQFAEDMLGYLTAFRPSTTDFKIYSRIYNSHDPDAFDDKDFTLLEQIDGIGVYSVLTNQSDMKEYKYTLPLYPNTAWTDSGTVTTTANSATVTGSGTNFSNLAVNDLVLIYSPLFPNGNYQVSVVNSVTNSSQITLTTAVTNNSMVATGLKLAKIGYPHQVFRDIQNDNVATYYNSSMTRLRTFDTFQTKVVFLSPDNHIVPKIDDIQVVAVSA